MLEEQARVNAVHLESMNDLFSSLFWYCLAFSNVVCPYVCPSFVLVAIFALFRVCTTDFFGFSPSQTGQL